MCVTVYMLATVAGCGFACAAVADLHIGIIEFVGFTNVANMIRVAGWFFFFHDRSIYRISAHGIQQIFSKKKKEITKRGYDQYFRRKRTC